MKASDATRRTPSCHALKRFVALPENRSALRAIRRFARFEGLPHPRRVSLPCLFLHGSPGTGKSHLVRGLLQRIIRRHPDRTARIIAARDLAHIVALSLRERSIPLAEREGYYEFRDIVALSLRERSIPLAEREGYYEFRDCDLLVVEDIQHLPASGADALSKLLDERTAIRHASVVTGACGPAGLTHLSVRLTSRLAAGLVVGMDSLSPSSRRRLAKAFCEQRGLYVTDDVLDWLARVPAGEARPILGDIIRLQRLSRIHAPPLDLATVTAELPDNLEAPLIEGLAQQVAVHYGLTCKQLKGRNRRRCLLWPRQVAMYLARKLTALSLAQIGACFGGYDHSTVLHACRKVDDRLTVDVGLPNELSQLAARCH